MLNVPMVFVYICLVVAILIVPSIILLVKSKGKQKSFFLYSLIPMIIAIGLLSLISYYTHEELEQKRQVEAYKNYCEIQIENFKDDYNYMLSEWEKINNDPNYVFEFDTSKLAYETTKTNFVNYFIEIYNDENIYKDRYTKYDYSSSYETYGLEISFYVSPKNELVLDENNNIVYEKLTTHIYNLPATNTNADYSQSKDALTQLENAKDRIIVGTQFNVVKDYDMLFYICMLVVLSITIVLNIITIILCLVRKQDKGESVTNNLEINIPENEVKEEKEQRKTWEELDKEEQEKYIKSSIKALYQKQLNDTETLKSLSREQRALKRDSLEMEEFLFEDLNNDEQKEVIQNAKNDYTNNEKKVIPTPTSTPNQKLAKFNVLNVFKWFFMQLVAGLLRGKDENGKPKGGKFGNAKILGEENINFDTYFPKGKLKLISPFHYCIIPVENILKFKLVSSNHKKSKYTVFLKDGHIIYLEIDSEQDNTLMGCFGMDLLEQ